MPVPSIVFLLFTVVFLGLAAVSIIHNHFKRAAGMTALVAELSTGGPMTLDQIARFMAQSGHGGGNYTWITVRDLMLSGVIEWPDDPASGLFRLAGSD